MPKVSIIVPIYKAEEYLRECIDSILDQTYTNFELILVDDGSPDSCGEICDLYVEKDNRIRVIHQTCQGLSAARNAGLELALNNSASEWICFVDSDDWIHKNYLNWLIHAASVFNVNIAACNKKEVSSRDDVEQIPEKPLCYVEQPDIWYTRNYTDMSAYVWLQLYRKSMWQDIKFPVGKIFEDIATTYKLLLRDDRIAVVDAPLYYYRINPVSLSRGKWTSAKMDYFWAMEKQLNDSLVKSNKKLEGFIAKIYLNSITWKIMGVIPYTDYSQEEKEYYINILKKKRQIGIKKYRKHLSPEDLCYIKYGVHLKDLHKYIVRKMLGKRLVDFIDRIIG